MSTNVPPVQEKISIRKFPIHKMKIKRAILLVGKKGTGKTTMLIDVIRNIHYHYDAAINIGADATLHAAAFS